ncbi:ABC transporter permease [Oceanobacillus oncorhynchi subsp. oncorhynchi]|uniref:ABC transporter permease n=1 Tax=Oceanobacillus oncorhynchi TaxID=545501 RepID=UPI0031E1C972
MMLIMEWKKRKRTGFILTFLFGAVLAACVPVLNMAFRSELYTGLDGSPLQILLEGNWQMIGLLNVSLIVIGASILYNTEYVHQAIQKMQSLPIKEGNLFLAKFLIISMACLGVIVIEAVAFAFSSIYWFPGVSLFTMEWLENISYFFILSLPAIALALMITSFFRNIWIALGINVIGIFLAITPLSDQSIIVASFPFKLPFQILHQPAVAGADTFIWIALILTVLLLLIQRAAVNIRRIFL